MCADKECGTFRVYTTSGHSATDWWLERNGSGTNGTTPPANPADINAVAGNPRQGEMEAKYKEGNERHWAKPRHFGADCQAGCRCVQTTEKVGEESVPEERPWRQPMTLTGNVKVVVRGKYKIKFQDFKGKCDINDEVGEPISYGGEESVLPRDTEYQGLQQKPV